MTKLKAHNRRMFIIIIWVLLLAIVFVSTHWSVGVCMTLLALSQYFQRQLNNQHIQKFNATSQILTHLCIICGVSDESFNKKKDGESK